MPTSVRLIKASNTPRDPQATDCSLLRCGGADAHLVDVLYKLRLGAASNDAAFVMEAADMQREKEFKFSDVVIEQGWTELPWEKMPREVYERIGR